MAGRLRVDKRITLTRLQYLCLIFGERCFYCAKDFPVSELTRDHVVPKALGGSEAFENQVPCCGPCNSAKGCRPPTDSELAAVAAVWESCVTRRIRKRHAPPCYVCNGDVASLRLKCCPECGRLPNGRHILLARELVRTA